MCGGILGEQVIYRANNLDSKRFTWRGPNHTQSRLDYFLIISDVKNTLKHVVLIPHIDLIIHPFQLLSILQDIKRLLPRCIK